MAGQETIDELQKVWDWLHFNRQSFPDEPLTDYDKGACWGLAYGKRKIEIAQEDIRNGRATR